MMQIHKTVEKAVEELIEEWNYRNVFDLLRVIRIKDIAKKMHPQYWKYRNVLLPKIQEWFKELPPFDAEKYSPAFIKRVEIDGKLYMVTSAHGMSDVYGHFVEGGHLGGTGCLLCLDQKIIKKRDKK